MKSRVLLIGILLGQIVLGATAVLNGGDLINSYLESMRTKIWLSTSQLLAHPDLHKDLCAKRIELNSDQRALCRAFIVDNLKQYQFLSGSESAITFSVVKEPLLVPDIDGTLRPVLARTPLGRHGNIEFNYEGVRFLSPPQLVQLLAHELGHKVATPLGNEAVNGEFYIQDNQVVGPFRSGRYFLDSVAQALTDFAEDHGLINPHFLVMDTFRCETYFRGVAGPVASSSGPSKRSFLDESGDRYDTGFGGNSRFFQYGGPDVHLELFISIHEEKGCATATDAHERWTEISLRNTHSGEILQTAHEPGVNPICDKTAAPIQLSWREASFSCTYEGSYADTERTAAE